MISFCVLAFWGRLRGEVGRRKRADVLDALPACVRTRDRRGAKQPRSVSAGANAEPRNALFYIAAKAA
jgi:hypothetical protein